MLVFQIIIGVLIFYYIFQPRNKKNKEVDAIDSSLDNCLRLHPDDIDEIILGVVDQLEQRERLKV